MDIEMMLAMAHEILPAVGAAATDNVGAGVPEGELWFVHEVIGWHDDPAGLTLNWSVLFTNDLHIPVGVTAVNTRVRFGAYHALPFWAGEGCYIRLQSSAAPAAGKKLYITLNLHKLRGVPAGSSI
jgi:hypothetical protein